ncbi:DUF333 domain-containing protein [Vibrio sp. AK197]
MNKALMLLGIAALTALTGCITQEPDKYNVEEWATTTNPASIYCVQRGAQLETVTENNARVTYCVFSDDTQDKDRRVEQWEYYREHHEDPNQQTKVKAN